MQAQALKLNNSFNYVTNNNNIDLKLIKDWKEILMAKKAKILSIESILSSKLALLSEKFSLDEICDLVIYTQETLDSLSNLIIQVSGFEATPSEVRQIHTNRNFIKLKNTIDQFLSQSRCIDLIHEDIINALKIE